MTPPPLPCPAGDTYLYLVRRGATDNSVAHPPRLQGCGSNLPLSAVGIEQAARMAHLLRERPIAAIYSSPLLRALQTAERIGQALTLSIELIEALTEVDVGQWEGRDWGEIERNEPEAFLRFVNDPATWPYAGGESFGQVQQRVMPVISQLLEQRAGQSFVVVSHNVVNRCILAEVMGLPLSQARTIPQENCGVSLIRRREGKTSLITLNSAFHLG
jgi:broad specificity phosphatase PhoE